MIIFKVSLTENAGIFCWGDVKFYFHLVLNDYRVDCCNFVSNVGTWIRAFRHIVTMYLCLYSVSPQSDTNTLWCNHEAEVDVMFDLGQCVLLFMIASAQDKLPLKNKWCQPVKYT